MNGSVLLAVDVVGVVCAALLLATEHSAPLYVWHVELPEASAALGSSNAKPMIIIEMRFITCRLNPFLSR